MPHPYSTAGIDAGATLCKLARFGDVIEAHRFGPTDVESVRAQLKRWDPQSVTATGGGALRFHESLSEWDVRIVPEFEAWARGATILAERSGQKLSDPYLLVSIGTGTSALRVHDTEIQRIGGTALGGGTLMGLGQLLTGAQNFEDLVAMAVRGDRSRVDLLVGDIYPGGDAPLPPEINAASFAKLDSRRPEDLARALMGMVGENIALICSQVARAAQIQTVVYGGTTLHQNKPLEDVIDWVTRASGLAPEFLPDGAFCGAVGAAAMG